MPQLAHHAALAGQREDLCDRRFRASKGHPDPDRRRVGTHRRHVGVRSRRPPPEAHGSGLLNGFQALAQETGVPVPKLDVVLVMLCST
jgi:hypothetical protein